MIPQPPHEIVHLTEIRQQTCEEKKTKKQAVLVVNIAM